MRYLTLCRVCALVVLVSVLPSAAAAIELGQWVPGLRLSPFLIQRFEYQTNVFQVPSGAQDDLVFRTIPGFVLDYGRTPLTLTAGYRAEVLRFLTLDSQNADHHIAFGQARLDLPRITALLRNDFTVTTDPPGSELTGRIGSRTNVLAPEVEYRLTPRLAVGGNYTWTHVDFDRVFGADDLNRDEHLFGVSAFWRVLPRADLRVSYAYGEKHFDDAFRDVTRHIVLVGVRGDLTPRLSSTLRVGYEHREAEVRGAGDFDGFVMAGDVTYRATPMTLITVYLDRSVQESVFADALFYVSTSGAVVVEHRFLRNLAANARVAVGHNDYRVRTFDLDGRLRTRSDMFYSWGAGIDYDILRWLRIGAEYAHTRRNSNFREGDFADDKLTARVTLQF